jgi:hypothetical protein
VDADVMVPDTLVRNHPDGTAAAAHSSGLEYKDLVLWFGRILCG